VIGAPLGGLLIASLGVVSGVRVAAAVTLLLALGVLVIQRRGYKEQLSSTPQYEKLPVRVIFASLPAELKQLLAAECLVRFGEGLAAAFIILYITSIRGYSAPAYGALYALQQAVSLIMYLPSGRLADLTGRRSMIALTFLFFSLFPLAVQWADGPAALALAFVIGGLKEMGEPARKALIVDLADPNQRARAVGVYYMTRNLLIVPAGFVGGVLWTRSAQLPLRVAGIVGLVGLLTFWISSRNSRSDSE
jgi:MFS family permease